MSKLKNENQLAGVLEHVLGKHSAKRIGETDLWKTVNTGASVVDFDSVVGGIGQTTLLKNGRDDELESDELGVQFMIDTGYTPETMISDMQLLKTAAGCNRVPEFQNSHPYPENRIKKIKEAINKFKQ